jgi:signal transduction histidine kinase
MGGYIAGRMPRHPVSRSVKPVFRPLKTYQVVVDLAVAIVFFAIAFPIESALVGWTGMDTRFGPAVMTGVAAFVAVIFSAALAFRRAAPAVALGIAWAGALLQIGLGRPPSFADVAIFAVLYATAAYGSARVYWAGFASTLIGAVIIPVYLMAGPTVAGGGLTWETLPLALVMLVAAAFALLLSWTAGALVRTAQRARENRAAQERAEADAIAEQERVRIARDMHDVVAHSLAVVIAQADGARYASPADSAVATEALGTISTTARAALADVRLLLTQLRQPRSLLPASPSAPWRASGGRGSVESAVPQPTLADLKELYAQVRAAGVDLRVDVDPAPPSAPPGAAQLAVYRILQEALTNALRHGAGPVDVRIAWLPDRVDLDVRNALVPGASPRGSGHGVIGMTERAQLAGGQLGAGAQDGVFVVRASIPIGVPA